MLSAVFVWITQALAQLGTAGLFVLMGLESAGAPVPAEVVLPLCRLPHSLREDAAGGCPGCGQPGGLSGFLLQYAFGRYGGRPLVEKVGHYLLISPQHLDQADRWFARHGNKAVFLARLLPVVRGLVSLPAGAARMPLIPFILW